jgi:hypothetical protein
MALSGRLRAADQCLLSGVKRTSKSVGRCSIGGSLSIAVFLFWHTSASLWQLSLIEPKRKHKALGKTSMDERRKQLRRRTLKAAKILIDGKSVIDCKIRNQTYKGACLEVASPIGIPDIFELSIPVDNVKHKCRVSWKDPKRIGVYFI